MMIQRSLDFYFKQTKGNSVNTKIESTVKPIRKMPNSKKVPSKLPRGTPIKSVFPRTQRTPMKLAHPEDIVIVLDDSNEETFPTSHSAQSTHTSGSPGPSTSGQTSQGQAPRSRSSPKSHRGNQNSRTSNPRTPKVVSHQAPKYIISLDDSDDECPKDTDPKPPIASSKVALKSPEKSPAPTPSLHPPKKSPETSASSARPSKKSPHPIRSLQPAQRSLDPNSNLIARPGPSKKIPHPIPSLQHPQKSREDNPASTARPEIAKESPDTNQSASFKLSKKFPVTSNLSQESPGPSDPSGSCELSTKIPAAGSNAGQKPLDKTARASAGMSPKSSKISSPKRTLTSSFESPGKRRRIREIISHQLTKENSFQGYTLTTTTSLMDSIDVPRVLKLESTKEVSFFDKTQGMIKEELMLSDDDWDLEIDDASINIDPENSRLEQTCLRVLLPETINRKFDSHQNLQNARHSHKSSQSDEDNKMDASKISTTDNSNLMQIFDENSLSFENDFGDFTSDLANVGCPETPKKKKKSTVTFRTPEKNSQSLRLFSQKDVTSQSPNVLRTPSKRSSFSPRKKSPRKIHYRSTKVFKETTNFQTVVENLNLAKEGAIPMNSFDLEEIYAKGQFKFQWGTMDTGAACRYDPQDVVLPTNDHSKRLFEMVLWVFSEPMNCGYFDAEERDLVFKMMSLPEEEQVLLARMMKRKVRWFRANKQNYEKHVEGSMGESFLKLASLGFFDRDWETVDVEIIFNLLQVAELKELCKLMKVLHTGAKPKLIAALKQLLCQKRSHFSTTSPREVLRARLTSVAGPILKLSKPFMFLIHRIVTLYYPNQDPEEKLSDVFHLFADVHYGNKTFPQSPISRFPVFRDRQALNDYVEAKLVWMELSQIMGEKSKGSSHWERGREYGAIAYSKLQKSIDQLEAAETNPSDQHQSISQGLKREGPTDGKPKLPSHIGRFSATYVWSKILFLSIESLKKLKGEGFASSVTCLEFLLKNRHHVPVNAGKIYKELTMIEMSHQKNLERSAELTLEAFATLPSIIDQAEMMERARKLAGRAKGLSLLTKNRLQVVLEDKEEEFMCIPKERSIEVTKVNREGAWGKSLWQINIGDAEKGYGSVEDVALRHYAEIGYPNGIHCEGTLPVTLFACLFWQEIYELPVPGAFISQFQREPLDIFGSNFYENRRDNFTRKFAELEALEDFEGVCHTMTKNYQEFSTLESVMCQIVPEADLFYQIVRCLGKNGVLGICKRIVLGGYVNWRSGFPDLFVWNDITGKCKVVEVKGPGDTLSVKQKLWIRYLEEIRVKVEVCHVKAKQQC